MGRAGTLREHAAFPRCSRAEHAVITSRVAMRVCGLVDLLLGAEGHGGREGALGQVPHVVASVADLTTVVDAAFCDRVA